MTLWYKVHLIDSDDSNDTIDTGPCYENDSTNNTNNSSIYWRQIAFLINNPREVLENEIIDIEIIVDRVSGVWCKIIE